MAAFALPNFLHKMCILIKARCQSRGLPLSFRVAAGKAQTRPTEPGSINGPSSSCMNIFRCFGRLRTDAEDKCFGWDVVGICRGPRT